MMPAFTYQGGIAASLPLANIDTDKILPAAFLKTITRHGLGSALFHAMRYDEEGQERSDFVLNQEPWRRASTLIALENFGCGSSREHAPWSLVDFGIRVIIAPSFADIFYNNCFKNGLLPIILEPQAVEAWMQAAKIAATATLKVDLPNQTLTGAIGTMAFAIPADRKRTLLLGLDDISESEPLFDDISRFEARRNYVSPDIPLELTR
ncbi:MAG: 3-isopropylmalate dehydratase small subunit [Sphingobium sp.]|uniref:3-isopropylmalate dehydratase small subunit n=1 Tax=Sphingobium sp. TaxID=1912891 RepID=UPI0029BEF544|nr:3-isopropylmalate dehydratase small subunit [Sphingobium sp.]MDX3911544.1 3-isopropylmalate dehydratase small subunit [Sphingobium sp.]